MKNIRNNKKNISGIYCIINLYNLQIYIGSSKDIYTRLRRHLSDLRKSRHATKHLQNSFNKRGEDNFYSIILEECIDDILIDKEEYWISVLKPEYNKILTNLLKPACSYNQETKDRISESVKRAHENGLINCNRKSIYVYSLNGIFIKSFNSLIDCSKELNVGMSNLRRCISGEKSQSKGYQFKLEYFEQLEKVEILKKSSRYKIKKPRSGYKMSEEAKKNMSNSSYAAKTAPKVHQYNKNLEFLKTWNSVREAAIYYNMVRSCISNNLAGLSKTTKYGIWKYNKIEN